MIRIGTAGLIVLTIVGILLGVIVILLGVLLAVSPGKTKPFLDKIGVGQMSYQLQSEMLSYREE